VLSLVEIVFPRCLSKSDVRIIISFQFSAALWAFGYLLVIAQELWQTSFNDRGDYDRIPPARLAVQRISLLARDCFHYHGIIPFDYLAVDRDLPFSGFVAEVDDASSQALELSQTRPIPAAILQNPSQWRIPW